MELLSDQLGRSLHGNFRNWMMLALPCTSVSHALTYGSAEKVGYSIASATSQVSVRLPSCGQGNDDELHRPLTPACPPAPCTDWMRLPSCRLTPEFTVHSRGQPWQLPVWDCSAWFHTSEASDILCPMGWRGLIRRVLQSRMKCVTYWHSCGCMVTDLQCSAMCMLMGIVTCECIYIYLQNLSVMCN